MDHKYLLPLVTLFWFQSLHSQNIPENISVFFNNLIYENNNLDQFVLTTEFEKADRLGISYEDIQFKYLLGYDIDPEVKENIRAGVYTYNLEEENIDDQFTRIKFTSRGDKYYKDFYFLNNKLISPVTYHTSKWTNISSKYLNLFISDSTLFNSYSAGLLDDYIEKMLDLLKIEGGRKKLLQERKIIYVLCRDAAQIKEVTGFETRGIYILAYDEVITTYNCHFHELAHLLINFKLKTLPLYTLSFFQEGFAVSSGGRGGQARNIMLDAGYFLHKSGFIPVNSILTQNNFHSEDPSTSYPVSALYSYFLLKSYGIESYLILYKKYSGDFNKISTLQPDMLNLPDPEEFEIFLSEYEAQGGISIEPKDDTTFKIFYHTSCCTISASDQFYKFSISQNITFSEKHLIENYRSSKFEELFPDVKYNGAKYAVVAKRNDISIYDLYSNILISSYYSGLTEQNKPVPGAGESFDFYVRKDVFGEELENMTAANP